MMKGSWYPPITLLHTLNNKIMLIKVLSLNPEKKVALIACVGETNTVGIVPEKSGFVRYDESVFKHEGGSSFETKDLKYADVGSRVSTSKLGDIFNWLVF